MAYPAKLAIKSSTIDPNPPQTFSFLSILTPEGSPLIETIHQEEELVANGINGRRWRTVNDQHMPFTMETTFEAVAYTNAVLLREYYRQSRGRFGELSFAASDFSTRYSVHIVDVDARCSPGRIVGANTSGTSLAVVSAKWTLVRIL